MGEEKEKGPAAKEVLIRLHVAHEINRWERIRPLEKVYINKKTGDY